MKRRAHVGLRGKLHYDSGSRRFPSHGALVALRQAEAMGGEMPLENFGDERQIAVERALAEFRAGRPVAIRSAARTIVAFPVDGLDARAMSFLGAEERRARLVVPGDKINAAGEWVRPAAVVRLHPFTIENMEEYIAHAGKSSPDFAPADRTESAALALAHLSQLLPAVAVAEPGPGALLLALMAVDAEDIFAFRDREAKSLKVVSRARAPLEGAGSCEFVVFRGGDGFRDQVAVIVGNPSPSRPVLTRLHSACLTGDLFGSLKCDCGEQLRGTVKAMAEQGGGVVLYLDQEGRGNGIANKIRAYRLQDQGFDTYDADEMLGFGQDQRRFDFAAEMLKQLGFHSVRLMTNNPRKIEALRETGLDVVSTHRVLTRPTAHNEKYLAAKRDKAGHLLGDAPPAGMDEPEALCLPSNQR
jgi:GTP cyclohydrolase II